MLRTDQLQLDLIINGDESRKKIVELKARAAELRAEMKKIKDQELLGKKAEELKKIDSEIEGLYHGIGIANMSMKELASRSKQLSVILSNLDPNTEEFRQYKKELDQVNARHKELKDGTLSVDKTIKKSMSGFSLAGIVAGGMAAYNTVASVFSGIKNAVMSSIEAYRAQEVAIQKVEQAIKQTGGAAGLSLKQLTDEANKLQGTTLFGDEEILNSATAQLLTFTNIAGKNFLLAQRAAMDLSTVLDGDLQSASLQLGKALNDPVSGLTALRRVGISFTDEQRKMIRELTETNRLEEAQAIILQEVNRQYGGSAEAVAKGSGALKVAGNQLGEMAESFGGFISRIITPIAAMIGDAAKRLNAFIGPSKSALETFEEHGRSVAALVGEIDPLLDRYDQLKSKASLNAGEQSELKTIIGQVAAVMPGAATAFDQYGNAIAISTDRVREYIKGQVLLLRYENKKAIDETIGDLAAVNVQIGQAQKNMDQIAKTGSFKISTPDKALTAKPGFSVNIRDANQAEILETQRLYQELINQRIALDTKLGNLRGDALLQSVAAYKAERAAAAESSKELADIKSMSVDELKSLEENGNETQKKAAKEETKRREGLAKKGEEYAKYMGKIAQDLENARLQILQDGRDKEIKAEELNFRRKMAEIKGNSETENQLRAVLESEFQQKKEAITKKYDDQERDNTARLEKQKWESRIKGLVDGSVEWFNVSQQMLAAQRELELSNTELTEQRRVEIEDRYRQLRQSLNTKPDDSKIFADLDSRHEAEWEATKLYLERTGQMTIAKKREIAAQERDMALSEADGNSQQQMLIWEQYYVRLGEINGEWYDTALQAITILVNSLSSLDSALAAYEQAQLQRDEEANNKKKDNLKKRLDAGLINQQQYDSSVAKMDEELAAKKRKVAHDEAIRQKAMSIVQSIINTAQAITAAMTVPYVGMALAIVAGVLGAAQVALIAATPIPEAAKGRYNVVGQDSGKRYRNVPYEGSYTGIPGSPLLINETGDEIVIDPETTRKLQQEAPYVIEAIRRVHQAAAGASGTTAGLTDEAKEQITISPVTLKYLQQNEPDVIESINRAARSEPGEFGQVKVVPKYYLPEASTGIIGKQEAPPTATGQKPARTLPVISLPAMERRGVEMPPIEPKMFNVNSGLISRALSFERSIIYPEHLMERPQSERVTEQPLAAPVIMKDPELMEAIRELRETMKKPIRAQINYDSMVESTVTVKSIETDTNY